MTVSFGSDENRMAKSQAPGFWLCASVMTDCDQTVAAIQEHARFYEGPIPAALRALLNGAIDHRREEAPIAALSALFEPASLAQMQRELPESAYVARYAEAREAESPKDSLGWLLFEPEEPESYWGALEFFCMDYDFLPKPALTAEGEPGDSPLAWRLPAEEQALFQRAALSYCQSSLDTLERALGLPTALLALHKDSDLPFDPASPMEERARWSEDWPPCCMKPEHTGRALSLLERSALDRSSQPPSPLPTPRRSRV